jgi:hypothetical protein
MQEKPINLLGSYQLVSGEHRQETGKIVEYPIGDGKHYKIFSDFFVVTVWQDTSENASSIYPGFNGGTYILKKNFLSVNYLVNTNKFAVGKTYYHLIKIDNNSLTIFPADENGNLLKYGFFETWQKIK